MDRNNFWFVCRSVQRTRSTNGMEKMQNDTSNHREIHPCKTSILFEKIFLQSYVFPRIFLYIFASSAIVECERTQNSSAQWSVAHKSEQNEKKKPETAFTRVAIALYAGELIRTNISQSDALIHKHTWHSRVAAQSLPLLSLAFLPSDSEWE